MSGVRLAIRVLCVLVVLSAIVPTVCTNQYDKSPNGSVWGYFICPKEGEDDDMVYCCGEDKNEFCCRKNPGTSTGVIVAIVLVPLLSPFLICLLIILIGWCCKRGKDKTNTGAASRSVHYQASRTPRTTPTPFSTTLSKQHPVTSNPGASRTYAPPPYASLRVGEKERGSQSSPPHGFTQ